MERELLSPTKLVTEEGVFNRESIGWSRTPLVTCNLPEILPRKKTWNYWCILGEEALFSARIGHATNFSMCFVYFFDYKTKQFFEKTTIIPKNKELVMTQTVHETIVSQHKDLFIGFTYKEDYMQMEVKTDDFNGDSLNANIKIIYPKGIESLNVVVPWSDEHFQFTSKQSCLPAEGYFEVGEKRYNFNPIKDFAILDYGRGVWPQECTWNWGMASGVQGEDIIGINFGGQWTDGTGSTENGILLNGVMHKISEDVEFIYNRENFMENWKIESSNVHLEFTPFYERHKVGDLSDEQSVYISEVYQMIGHYNGEVTLANKQVIKINNLLGCIEEHIATW